MAERFAEQCIVAAFSPDAVIHMGAGELQAERISLFRKQAQKRHGIRTAGKRDQQMLSPDAVRHGQGTGIVSHEIILHNTTIIIGLKKYSNRFSPCERIKW
jgi:hypothetical protein